MERQLRGMEISLGRPRISGLRTGWVVSLGSDRELLVDYEDNPHGPLVARCAGRLERAALERAERDALELLIAFERSDPRRPIVVDTLSTRAPSMVDEMLEARRDRPATEATPVEGLVLGEPEDVVDGELRVRVAGGVIAARTITPLRNLSDPVVVWTDACGAAIVLGQVRERVELAEGGEDSLDIAVRGRRVAIEAEEEIVLRSGGSEVRIDSRGKVSTTSDQVVTRGRRLAKIQGGAVQLN